jgi:hypothetical protein
MDRAEFTALRDRHYAAIAEINDRKGHDYAGEEDALANFKKDDERLRKIVENDPVLAKWYIYFDKHYEAVMTFLEEGDVKSEPIEGRIHDMILYSFLLLGLIEEKKPALSDTVYSFGVDPGTGERVRTRLGQAIQGDLDE